LNPALSSVNVPTYTNKNYKFIKPNALAKLVTNRNPEEVNVETSPFFRLHPSLDSLISGAHLTGSFQHLKS
jgi:hypothetical protein